MICKDLIINTIFATISVEFESIYQSIKFLPITTRLIMSKMMLKIARFQHYNRKQPFQSSLKVMFVVFSLVFIFGLTEFNWFSNPNLSSLKVYGYKVKHTTDPTFECSGCARTRLIGCFGGQCSYRCYRSCTNGTNVVIGMYLCNCNLFFLYKNSSNSLV